MTATNICYNFVGFRCSPPLCLACSSFWILNTCLACSSSRLLNTCLACSSSRLLNTCLACSSSRLLNTCLACSSSRLLNTCLACSSSRLLKYTKGTSLLYESENSLKVTTVDNQSIIYPQEDKLVRSPIGQVLFLPVEVIYYSQTAPFI